MRGQIIRLVLFAAMCIGLTVYIGAKIAGVSLGGGYSLGATFGDATGLRKGDPVRLAGVPIGKVTSVRLVNGAARVELRINDNVHVPDDSEVAVRWRNLIGDRYVGVVPGQSTTMYRGGAEVTRTASAVDLGAFVNKLGPLIAQISPQQLNTIFGAINQALDGNVGNAESLIVDLNNLLGTLAQRTQTIGQLVTDSKTITATLAVRDQQIQAMVDNLASLSTAFAGNTNLVGSALDQLAGLSSGLDQLLTRDGTQIHGVVDNLGVLTGVLHARVGDLQAALHDLPSALQTLFLASDRGEFVDIQEVCISIQPTCAQPIVLAGTQQGPKAGQLNTAAAFSRLILGPR